MQRHLDQDLVALKEKLLTMASFAETAVVLAMKALAGRDAGLAGEVVAADTTLDRFEIELDELCINLLALKAPIAADLRLITAAMKINQNLERVGDEAAKIAKCARALSYLDESAEGSGDIPRLAETVIVLLRTSLDAFVKGDTGLARECIQKDREIDARNKSIQGELADVMVKTPHRIGACLQRMIVSKSLERIADHAVNVAEEVVFLYEGKDIRHLAVES